MRLEDLKIYQKAHCLAVEIHKMTLKFPSFEMFEEGSQIRRSSKSVAAQIVEGYSLRNYKKEYILYLSRAYASCRETMEHLDLLYKTKSLKDEKDYHQLRMETLELTKMLYAFIQTVFREHKLPKLKIKNQIGDCR